MQDKRIIRTRRLIFDSLQSLIQECDYKDITVTNITNKANIGRKTFYLHFSSIEDLIHQYCDEIYNSVIIDASAHIKETKNYTIETFLLELNKAIRENITIFEKIVQNDSYKIFKEEFQRIVRDINIYIVKEVYKLNTPYIDLYASFYSAGIIDMYFKYLKHETNLTLDEISRHCYRGTFLGVINLINDLNC